MSEKYPGGLAHWGFRNREHKNVTKGGNHGVHSVKLIERAVGMVEAFQGEGSRKEKKRKGARSEAWESLPPTVRRRIQHRDLGPRRPQGPGGTRRSTSWN